MLPGTNIIEGELKLRRVTELSYQFKDVIAPESRGDIQVATDFATAIREEYDAVVQGNPIFNIGGRIKLARQYNRAAGKALDRTKHITDMASRNVQRGHNSPVCDDTLPAATVERPRMVDLNPEETNSTNTTGQSPAESPSNSVPNDEECDQAAEDERSRAGIPDQQSAHYECVELKICSSNNKRIVEMKLQNMSNPELSVEADCIRFGRANRRRDRSP